MQFQIRMSENSWNITPLSGALEGVVVATAEGVSMKDATFEGKCIYAAIKALWGVTVLDEALFDDMETFKALHLGGRFDTGVEDKIYLQIEGFIDRANNILKGARRMVVLKSSIFAKGALCR